MEVPVLTGSGAIRARQVRDALNTDNFDSVTYAAGRGKRDKLSALIGEESQDYFVGIWRNASAEERAAFTRQMSIFFDGEHAGSGKGGLQRLSEIIDKMREKGASLSEFAEYSRTQGVSLRARRHPAETVPAREEAQAPAAPYEITEADRERSRASMRAMDRRMQEYFAQGESASPAAQAEAESRFTDLASRMNYGRPADLQNAISRILSGESTDERILSINSRNGAMDKMEILRQWLREQGLNMEVVVRELRPNSGWYELRVIALSPAQIASGTEEFEAPAAEEAPPAVRPAAAPVQYNMQDAYDDYDMLLVLANGVPIGSAEIHGSPNWPQIEAIMARARPSLDVLAASASGEERSFIEDFIAKIDAATSRG
jgi:hypothetical protein